MPWIKATDGQAPPRAQAAGHCFNGEPIYIARAWHRGALTPGKLIVSMGCAAISWGGLEYKKFEYEVLVDGPKNWVKGSGEIPSNAYPGGMTENDEVLFIGRTDYLLALTPGKVHASQNLIYIPFEGKERKFSEYEILCH